MCSVFGNIVILESNYYLGKEGLYILILGVRGVHKRIRLAPFFKMCLSCVMYLAQWRFYEKTQHFNCLTFCFVFVSLW